jgi:hypothetical protein
VRRAVSRLRRLCEGVQDDDLLLEERVVLRLVLVAKEFVLRAFRFVPPFKLFGFRLLECKNLESKQTKKKIRDNTLSFEVPHCGQNFSPSFSSKKHLAHSTAN